MSVVCNYLWFGLWKNTHFTEWCYQFKFLFFFVGASQDISIISPRWLNSVEICTNHRQITFVVDIWLEFIAQNGKIMVFLFFGANTMQVAACQRQITNIHCDTWTHYIFSIYSTKYIQLRVFYTCYVQTMWSIMKNKFLKYWADKIKRTSES